jgi:phenylacetic acid degradation operon negative regulatory protein
MAVKDRRTKILLSLFLLSDVAFSPVVIDDKVQTIFDFTFNQKTKTTLTQLAKEGSIEKREEGAVVTCILTNKGFDELCMEFPSFRFLKHTWDKKWRVISYEIPESKREIRDRLRREMQGWGLGPWHRSFWLTPHPIIPELNKLVSGRIEEQYIQAFESDHVFGDKNVLIEKVWGKTQLDKKYREMFKKWHDILSHDGEKGAKLTKVIDEYIPLLREDPGLPEELIGKTWIGFEALNIFKEIRSILLS